MNRSWILKFILLFTGENNHFHLNLNDEVVRGSIILHEGRLMWPPPKPVAPPAATPPATAPSPAATKSLPAPVVPNYFNDKLKDAALYSAGKVIYNRYSIVLFESKVACFGVSAQAVFST